MIPLIIRARIAIDGVEQGEVDAMLLHTRAIRHPLFGALHTGINIA